MARLTYPAWYHTLRGLIVGLTIGVWVMMGLYDSRVVEPGERWWPIITTCLLLSPVVLLALFEIGFAIRRHRSVHFFGRMR